MEMGSLSRINLFRLILLRLLLNSASVSNDFGELDTGSAEGSGSGLLCEGVFELPGQLDAPHRIAYFYLPFVLETIHLCPVSFRSELGNAALDVDRNFLLNL